MSTVARTVGWVKRFLEELRDLGTGIVYGNDGIQGEALPTQWVMTADIVQTLGCMVPSEVEHLYCDNVIKALGDEAGCLRYLPDVFIEHMHAFAGKAPLDHGYIRVNNGAQYARDSAAFERWRDGEMPGHVSAVRALRSNVTGRSGAA